MVDTEEYLIGLMRDLCDELGLPEEKREHSPILEALNRAHNRGALGCASRFASSGLLRESTLGINPDGAYGQEMGLPRANQPSKQVKP